MQQHDHELGHVHNSVVQLDIEGAASAAVPDELS